MTSSTITSTATILASDTTSQHDLSLDSHIQSQYRCDVGKCSEVFQRRDALLRHKREVHESASITRIRCTHVGCSSSFKRQSHLREHLRNIHDNVYSSTNHPQQDSLGDQPISKRLKSHSSKIINDAHEEREQLSSTQTSSSPQINPVLVFDTSPSRLISDVPLTDHFSYQLQHNSSSNQQSTEVEQQLQPTTFPSVTIATTISTPTETSLTSIATGTSAIATEGVSTSVIVTNPTVSESAKLVNECSDPQTLISIESVLCEPQVAEAQLSSNCVDSQGVIPQHESNQKQILQNFFDNLLHPTFRQISLVPTNSLYESLPRAICEALWTSYNWVNIDTDTDIEQEIFQKLVTLSLESLKMTFEPGTDRPLRRVLKDHISMDDWYAVQVLTTSYTTALDKSFKISSVQCGYDRSRHGFMLPKYKNADSVKFAEWYVGMLVDIRNYSCHHTLGTKVCPKVLYPLDIFICLSLLTHFGDGRHIHP